MTRLALVLALTVGCTVRAAADLPPERGSSERQRSDGFEEPEPPAGEAGWVGVVMARDAVDLATELEGKLAPIDAALGDWVEPNEVVASIEAPVVEAELDGARAALRSAEAELAERELAIREARRGHQRERALSDVGASSGEQRERAELSVDKAIIAERRAAALVAERRAEVTRLEARLAGGRLHAPFRGRVSRWYRSPGEVVQAGERVVRIADVDRLWVRFALPVADLGRVREGQAIEVRLVPDSEPLYGVVRHIAPELDLASQMMLVEAELNRPSGEAARAEAGQACYVKLAAEEMLR